MMVMILNTQADFYMFLQEYADFLEEMIEAEKEKLAALVSNELVRIEHSITVQQATAMQFENMEKKRLKLQRNAGFENMTFSEIIEAAREEDQQMLSLVFRRIQQALDQIKYLNSKSMDVVKTHINLSKITTESQVNQAYGYSKEQGMINNPKGSLLEKKI